MALAFAPMTLMAQDYYPVSFDKTTVPAPDADKADRTVSAIKLGSQQVDVNQRTANLVYIERLSDFFSAKAGESVTPSFAATMDWMHGFVFVDWGRDGQFDVDYTSTEVTAAKDLVSYSYYEGKNSTGASVKSENPGYNPPAFTVPAGTPDGYYRVRYKIDWSNVDPAGSSNIVRFGGAIVDTRLNVHGDNVNLTVVADENGTLTAEDGSELATTVPFGQDLVVRANPSEGYSISSLRIKHGYNFDGEETVYGVRQWQSNSIRSFSFKNGVCTIPAKYIDGNVELTAVFAKGGSSEDGDEYSLSFDKEATQATPDNALKSITLTNAAGTASTVEVAEGNTVYRNLLDKEIGVKAGEVLTPSVVFDGSESLNAYLYVDVDQNGGFYTEMADNGGVTENSELVSFSSYNGKNSLGETATSNVAMPSFTLPDELPVGVYRARLKLDINNDNSAAASSDIAANNGYVVDFLLNVHEDNAKLEVNAMGGHVIGANNGTVGETVAYGTPLTLHTLTPAEGYVVDHISVYHGHNLNGPEFINGNRQWERYVVEDAEANADFTIPAEKVNGEVLVKAYFKTDGTEEYKLVFDDEFNLPDGSEPDEEVWNYGSRGNATWQRFLANTTQGRKETAFIRDGKLVTRCFAPEGDLKAREGNVDMISGGVDGSFLCNFTYGRFETRVKTLPHIGNFPAFWLMPDDWTNIGWPQCGEIDIWEQVDASERAYGTVHTNCTYNLGIAKPNSGNSQYNPAEYSVITLDWTPELLKWYVNGKQIFSYAKSTNQDWLDKGQWPFDKGFYIILNQSVGNGSWAKSPDKNFQYETTFDYVRVYQTDDMENELSKETGVSTVKNKANTVDVYAQDGGLLLVATQEQVVNIYNLVGSRVYSQKVQGNQFVALAKGVYMLNGKKYLVK